MVDLFLILLFAKRLSVKGNVVASFQLLYDRPFVAHAQTHGPRWVAYQGGVDYAGSDFTGSLTLANPDIFSMSGVAVAQYLQSFTQRQAS